MPPPVSARTRPVKSYITLSRVLSFSNMPIWKLELSRFKRLNDVVSSSNCQTCNDFSFSFSY